MSNIRVGICDDSLDDLRELKKYCEDFGKQYCNMNLEFVYFDSSIEIREEIENLDICILDIVMPELDGIALGKAIRQLNATMPIVFTTTSPEFALKAYAIEAIRYLMKPVAYEDFEKALLFALNLMQHKEILFFPFNTQDGVERLRVDEIACIENNARRLLITKTDGTIKNSIYMRQSFDECIHELIENPSFIRTHKSFLVNMNCISKISAAEVVLDSGKIVPVSRANASMVKSRYLKYLAGDTGKGMIL